MATYYTQCLLFFRIIMIFKIPQSQMNNGIQKARSLNKVVVQG